MKKYAVISRQYDEVVPILDDGSGPTESGCDYIEIEAENKREAKVLGLKLWKEKHWNDNFGGVGNGENPFQGVKVEEIEKFDYEYKMDYEAISKDNRLSEKGE